MIICSFGHGIAFGGWGLGLGVSNGVVQALFNNEHSTFNQVFRLHLYFSMHSTNKQEVRMLENLGYLDHCWYQDLKYDLSVSRGARHGLPNPGMVDMD